MATPTLNDMREIVRNEYPGQKWKDKVDKMPDGQVIALYFHFINRALALRRANPDHSYQRLEHYKKATEDILKENQLHFCDPDDLA